MASCHSLLESKKITVLEKHINDMESRLTMATSIRTDPLCSEVIPEIIKDSKSVITSGHKLSCWTLRFLRRR